MEKRNLDKFKGVIVALYSCLDKEGKLNIEAVKRLSRFYADKGVNGLYVCGSSGEGFLLTVEERKKTLEAVMEEVGKEMTIIAHVGAVTTCDSIELAIHAEKFGADGVSAVPNVYYKIPEQSIERHWMNIVNSTDLPFIIYNIPQTTGYNLSLDLLKRMVKNEKVIGVKNTSMSTYDIQQFKKAGGENFLVFNGPDEQYISGRIMGADAGIGGTYGVMPELYLKMEELFKLGKIEEAQTIQYKINEIIAEMLTFPSLYGAAKAIIKLRGIDIGEPRLPLEPVPEEGKEKVECLYRKIMDYIEELKK